MSQGPGELSTRWKDLDRKPVRYVLVGGVGAVIETVLFSGFIALGLNLVGSNFLAFHFAFVTCYFLHRRYTHGQPPAGRRKLALGLTKYAAVMYGQLSVGYYLLWIFMTKAGLPPGISKLLQIALVTPAAYFLQKKMVFR